MRWFAGRVMAWVVCTFVTFGAATTANAQSASVDPVTRIKQVLPPDVATRVIALIDRARSRELPADALQNRALKFAARGVDPRGIEQALADEVQRMEGVRDTLQKARGRKPDGDLATSV